MCHSQYFDVVGEGEIRKGAGARNRYRERARRGCVEESNRFWVKDTFSLAGRKEVSWTDVGERRGNEWDPIWSCDASCPATINSVVEIDKNCAFKTSTLLKMLIIWKGAGSIRGVALLIYKI